MLNGLFENLKTASTLREISIWWGIAERTVLGLGKNMSDYDINIRCKILQTIWRFLHKEVITFLLGNSKNQRNIWIVRMATIWSYIWVRWIRFKRHTWEWSLICIFYYRDNYDKNNYSCNYSWVKLSAMGWGKHLGGIISHGYY